MRLQTKEQIQDWLKAHKKNDSFAILFWSKDEFEDSLERDITEKEWKQSVNGVNADDEDQAIAENLEDHLSR